MITIENSDPRLAYPGFYNLYPIKSETSIYAITGSLDDVSASTLYLDDFYGRLLNPKVSHAYGRTHNLHNYVDFKSSRVVEELRVPFRRIPLYQFESFDQIKQIVSTIERDNPNHEILIRGQTSLHPIVRSASEKEFLYGDPGAYEPSFLPSFLRSNFNEHFINSLWHSQLAMLLNDVGIDLSSRLKPGDYNAYREDVRKIRYSPDFTPLALGIAQHYGLPSIGLDLTKTLNVAAWFASHRLLPDPAGKVEVVRLDDFSRSTLFIFRCPKDSVFAHMHIKPKFTDNTRPDRQDAWFGHVGWGFAKNEMASFLVCGIRLNETVFEFLPHQFEKELFPNRKEDLFLNYFLNIKENPRYSGEVKRALDKIYSLL